MDGIMAVGLDYQCSEKREHVGIIKSFICTFFYVVFFCFFFKWFKAKCLVDLDFSLVLYLDQLSRTTP